MLVDQKPAYRSLTLDDYQAMAGPDWPEYSVFAQGIQIEKFVADELDSMLGQTAQLQSQISNFCVLPFYGREYPTNSHCCLLPMDVDIDRVREDMLSNRRTLDCQACWTLEDAGALSDRQIKNRTLDFYTNTDITKLYQQALAGNYEVNHYKISAGNYCNSTCVSCSPMSSSAWADLANPKNKKRIPIMMEAESKAIKIDYATAKFITFTGGESTMIRTHWDIVEKLVDVGNTNCCISFVTNGSFLLSRRQKELLSKFKYVSICFSIDGVGPVFEYLRYPLSWTQLLANIKWAKDQNYMVSVSYTISNLNILYHEQTVAWFKENNLPYIENPIYRPSYFSPSALPKSIKDKILEQSNNSIAQTFLTRHTLGDQAQYQEFLAEIHRQDRLKQISINDYLPEFVALM